MKRTIGWIVFIPFLSASLLASGFALNLNIGYNAGNSDFFGSKSTIYMTNGENYLEKSRYGMGIGFGLNLYVPLGKRLFAVPGISVDYGNRGYVFSRVDGESDADVNEHYYFHLIRTGIKLNYDLIVLKNGWRFSVSGGAGYNTLKADALITAGDTEFWNVQFGVVIRFFQLKHFGFLVAADYIYPFGNRNFEYLSVNSGVVYRF